MKISKTGAMFLFPLFPTIVLAYALISKAHNYEILLIVVGVYAMLTPIALRIVSGNSVAIGTTKVLDKIADNVGREKQTTPLTTEPRETSVLFSGIASFSTYAYMTRPKEIVESLNSYFETMVPIIQNRNGTVDKFMGDKIMAFFSAPADAVFAAVEIEATIESLNAKRKQKGQFQIGIGINKGPAMFGAVGTRKIADFTVIGHTVNLAFRLQSLSEALHVPILVSEDVKIAASGKISWRLVELATFWVDNSTAIYVPRDGLSSIEREAWLLHEYAMNLYYSRKFSEAEKLFHDVSRLLPYDPIAERFVERCQLFQRTPPSEEWNGAVRLEKKWTMDNSVFL